MTPPDVAEHTEPATSRHREVPISLPLRIVLGFVRMASFLLALGLTLLVVALVGVFGLHSDASLSTLVVPAVAVAIFGVCAYPAGLVVVMFGGERRWPWVVPGAAASLWTFRGALFEFELVAWCLLGSMLLLAVQVALTWTPAGWRTWRS